MVEREKKESSDKHLFERAVVVALKQIRIVSAYSSREHLIMAIIETGEPKMEHSIHVLSCVTLYYIVLRSV